MKTIGYFILFILVIYITINYAHFKYNVNKEKIIVKELPLPTTFYDFFRQRSLITDYAQMFGIEGNELNLINSQNDISNKNSKTAKKNDLYVPQRIFVNM